jgi:hypothetical protein
MTQNSASASGAAAPLSLPQRFLGVLFSPRPTFESVVAHPAWLGIFALTILIALASWGAFLWTDVGRQAFIDQSVVSAERWGQTITPEVEARIASQFPVTRIITLVAILFVSPIILVLIAGVAYGIFGAILGGGGSFKQTMAVVAHAGVISTVTGLFVLALNYLRQSMTSATTLAVFMPMLEENSVMGRFLGSIDLIWVWYLVILAVGLAVLYRRKAGSIAGIFLGLYVVIALIIAVVRSAMGGS